MTGLGPPSDERDVIRATYEAYQRADRGRLWDLSDPGFGRLAAQRDAAIIDLIEASAGEASQLRLLDLGCGFGSLAVACERAGLPVRYTGLDLLDDRLAAARSAAPWARFVQGSADALPFDDASFDLVAALTLFSSLPSKRMESAVADEIRRVVRPGGWLIWYDLRYPNPWNPAVHAFPARRVRALFPGWGGQLRPISLLPPLARRLGPAARVLYPALHLLPPLRSHFVGRLRRPG